ncbi:MAG: permease [Lachnospiraceae bacterium]|jgi:putative transport protein
MNLFGGVIPITGITFLMFSIFAIAFVGYFLGRITIKDISLGTAGVFIIALVFGALFSNTISKTLTLGGTDISLNAFKIIETVGLILFVGSVGMIAGPNFFKNLKMNFKSYILVGLACTIAGSLATFGCFYIGIGKTVVPAEEAALGITKAQYFMSMMVGIMSGSLTSTPAFSATKDTAASIAASAEAAAALEDVVTVGHAIAYIFGVIGVVLFVQVVPKLVKANMEKERQLITIVDTGNGSIKDVNKKRFEIDEFGFGAFSLVVILGVFIGMIKIPLSAAGLDGVTFSLTTTGGVLIAGLMLSHFGHIGPVSLQVSKKTLEAFREFGLMLFLIGAGIPGGASFVKYFQPVYFLYGIIITIVPMIVGYFLARKLLKLSLLNSLGSITGGMTSTPALGTLIRCAGTDDVASSYASTYPIALISVVFASQILVLLSNSLPVF